MRLIDADALLRDKEDHDRISTHLIYNAPTINAVPIDWLMEQEENVLNGDDFRDECAGVRLAWMAEAERKEE